MSLDFFQVYIVVVTVSFSLCVVLGAHSGDAMWVVRVDMSAKDLLTPFPVLKTGHMVSLLKMSISFLYFYKIQFNSFVFHISKQLMLFFNFF